MTLLKPGLPPVRPRRIAALPEAAFNRGILVMPTHPQGRAFSRIAIVGALLCVGIPAFAPAQAPDSALPSPRLLTLFPPGGKVGTVVEVGFTGVDLEDPEKLLFSHPNVKAEPIVPPA